jgi:hypothetical protein
MKCKSCGHRAVLVDGKPYHVSTTYCSTPELTQNCKCRIYKECGCTNLKEVDAE